MQHIASQKGFYLFLSLLAGVILVTVGVTIARGQAHASGVPANVFIAVGPTSVLPGATSTLTWFSANATACSGTNFDTTGATSGTIVVGPAITTTYTVSCIGPGGISQPATATLTVSASSPTSGRVLRVGPTEQYTMPSQAIAAAQDGDTILIDPATYTDDFKVGMYNAGSAGYPADTKIIANNVTLMGLGGRAHINQDYVPNPFTNNRGLWNVVGNNVTIENIEFSGATGGGTGMDANDSGVFAEGHVGANITVLNCYFHDNQEGMLVGDNANSTITIENTEFNHNAIGGYGFAHNLYMGHIKSLVFVNNYTHNTVVGHELKTRAYNNYIAYNRIMNETGNGSYEIDMPNGGSSYIIGNEIEQGPNGQNNNIISYAEEGASNPLQQLYIANNTIVNDLTGGNFIKVSSATTTTTLISNNFFVGPGRTIVGASLGAGNVIATSTNPGFLDKTNYDYHLTASSPAIDRGVVLAAVNGVSLTPVEQYFHPTTFETRVVGGSAIDAGAYEYAPQALLIANPSVVTLGQTTTLTWSSANASSCTGTGISTGGATSGSFTISPLATTTYSVTCTSPQGSASATAVVAVNPPPVYPPTVTTAAASAITSRTATVAGGITDTRGADASQSGFVYGTDSTLASVIATSTLGAQTGDASLSQSLSGLTPSTTYYVRAYATNSAGTGYGPIVTFTTAGLPPTVTTSAASSIGRFKSTLNGAITATGGTPVTVRGFVWGSDTSYGATTTETGSFGTSTFKVDLSQLACHSTYHYAAYATNSVGTSYGADQTFTPVAKGACPTAPTVTTQAATGITQTTATLTGGFSLAVWGAIVTTEGFNYGPTTSYGLTASVTGSFGTNITSGRFTQQLTGLSCNTTYHYEAFATNGVGTGTSPDKTFTTRACQ